MSTAVYRRETSDDKPILTYLYYSTTVNSINVKCEKAEIQAVIGTK